MINEMVELEDEPVAVQERTQSQEEHTLRHRIGELERQRDRADLERETFLGHIRDLHYRNDLLQQRLDESIGREARKAADDLDLAKLASTKVRGPYVAKQERSVILAATYRVAMQSIGRPATAAEIAQVLGYTRERVFSWLNTTGKKLRLIRTMPDERGNGRLPVYFAWPVDARDAS